MTLRHVVSWKMNGETREERNVQAAEISAVLEGLTALVPSIRALSVHRNELFDGENFDVILVVDFDDEAGFEAYAQHPDHVAVLPIVRARAAGRCAIDFTI